ncbi:MAG TPA: hypothetical protein PK239_06690 [Chitinophagales bacterium]|nr:hypothetical protein [Chitinophagales bacterium]HRK26964.1 hypothetical protein [Chitinophagales bacterium]
MNDTPKTGTSFAGKLFMLLLLVAGVLVGVKYWQNQTSANEKQYLYNVQIADSLYKQKAYAEALNFYQTALGYQPNDRYAQEQIKSAQANLNISFLNTFGGAGADEGNVIALTPDGGYLIVGSTASWGNGNADGWIIKTDAHGQLERRQTVGAQHATVLHGITPAYNNLYYAAGTTKTPTSSHILLLNLNAEGRILWEQTAALDTVAMSALAVVQHPIDSTIWVAGHIQQSNALQTDALLAQFDKQGNLIQIFTYGNPAANDAATALVMASDSTFILAGFTQQNPDEPTNGWIVMAHTNGKLLWQKTSGGVKNDVFTALTLLPDGRITAAGHTQSLKDSSLDLWVVQFSPTDGAEIWNKTIGENGNDAARSILFLPDGGFIVAGYTNSYGQKGKDIWLLKLFRNGHLDWKQEIGDTEDDAANAVLLTPDGGFALCGYLTKNQNADLCIVKTDVKGLLQNPTAN